MKCLDIPLYLARINIDLRKSILDPQGKAVHHALESLGMNLIIDVRMGKYIELKIDTPDEKIAANETDAACKKLLANPIMEDYTFTLEKIS